MGTGIAWVLLFVAVSFPRRVRSLLKLFFFWCFVEKAGWFQVTTFLSSNLKSRKYCREICYRTLRWKVEIWPFHFWHLSIVTWILSPLWRRDLIRSLTAWWLLPFVTLPTTGAHYAYFSVHQDCVLKKTHLYLLLFICHWSWVIFNVWGRGRKRSVPQLGPADPMNYVSNTISVSISVT